MKCRVSHYAFLVLVASVLLVFLGVRMALAGISSYRAESFLTEWGLHRVEPKSESWQIGRLAAERAVAAYPIKNGEYLDRLGRVYSWRHFDHGFGAPIAAQSRADAVAAYREAARLRPTYPYIYTRLAAAKLRALQLDGEFRSALSSADTFAGGDMKVYEELVETGMIAWPSLGGAERSLVLKRLKQLFKSESLAKEEMARLARLAGVSMDACESANGGSFCQ